MSRIVADIDIMQCVDRTTPQTAEINMDEVDVLSVGVTVTAATGSNLLELLESVDGKNFVPVASLVITVPVTIIWHIYPVFSHYKKITYTPGTGAATFTVHINSRNNTIPSRGSNTEIVMS